MITTRGLAALLAVLSTIAVAAPAAVAQQPAPVPGNRIGLEIKRVDPATRTIEAVQHCTDPATAGTVATFKIPDSFDMTRIPARAIFGAVVDRSTTPATIVEVVPVPCSVQPGAGGPEGGPGGGPGGPGGGPGGPGGGPAAPACGPAGPGGGPAGPTPGAPKGPAAANAGPAGCGTPSFAAGFLSRVWKFQGEVDAFADGRLSLTVAKILNLPKRMRDQDDELVDESAYVLVGDAVRIVKDGKRVAASALAGAENVVVHGKLLRPSKWQKDEDGEPTATIRAKKIVILG